MTWPGRRNHYGISSNQNGSPVKSFVSWSHAFAIKAFRIFLNAWICVAVNPSSARIVGISTLIWSETVIGSPGPELSIFLTWTKAFFVNKEICYDWLRMEKPTKITYLLFGSFLGGALIHNGIAAVFGAEEPVFFLVSLLSGLGFVGSVFYNLFTRIKKGVPKDIWKLGWLGFFGITSLACSQCPGLLLSFLFWGFFFFKKK